MLAEVRYGLKADVGLTELASVPKHHKRLITDIIKGVVMPKAHQFFSKHEWDIK